MKYFGEHVFENAKRHNSALSAYVNVLMNHGVVGMEKRTVFTSVRHFLYDHIRFEDNGENLIWHPDLDDVLKRTFKKHTK